MLLNPTNTRVTWLDVLRYWAWRASRALMATRARPHQPAPAQTGVQLMAQPAVGYVDVGRRFPIRADRVDGLYCAADERF
jgi:hypothetical protein